MMDTDQDMEMERMDLEAFGRFDKLQKTNGVKLERHERGILGQKVHKVCRTLETTDNDLPNCNTKHANEFHETSMLKMFQETHSII